MIALKHVVPRVWRFLATTTLILAICMGFALTLGKLSEGVGDIFVVDSGPLDPTTREPIAQPVVIPLGGKISYGVRWHYVEGGCSATVQAAFVQVEKADGVPVTTDRAQIVFEHPARVFAIGLPGYDPIERSLPPGVSPGLWHYSVRVVGVSCPTRHPRDQPFAAFDIKVVDPHAPVVTVHALVITTPRVAIGGTLSYRISFSRRIAAPGVLIATFTAEPPSQIPGLVDVIVTQRPLAYAEARTYRDVDVERPLPPDIRLGHWKLKLASLQNIPGGQQVDSVGDLDFEVVP